MDLSGLPKGEGMLHLLVDVQIWENFLYYEIFEVQENFYPANDKNRVKLVTPTKLYPSPFEHALLRSCLIFVMLVFKWFVASEKKKSF